MLSLNLRAGKNAIHTLANVLHIPSAPSCLLFIPKSNETVHGQVILKENKVILLNNKGTIIGTGNKSRKLYVMQAVSIPGPVLVLLAIPTTSTSWEIWHQHFGHIGMSGLKLLHDKALAQGFNVNLTSNFSHKYASCIASKMTRQLFLSVNKSCAKEVGEKTHSNIWGSYCVQSLQGSQYFITFIEDYTCRVMVYFPKEKSQAKKKNIYYYAWLKAHSIGKPKALKVDQGSEYLQHAIVDFIRKERMDLEVTAPYSHQQHGTAEHAMQTLVELARAMLAGHNLPVFLWEGAVSHTAYLQNWVQCKRWPTTHCGRCGLGRSPVLQISRNLGSQSGCTSNSTWTKCGLGPSNTSLPALLMKPALL